MNKGQQTFSILWIDNEKKIRQLWPAAQWGDEEHELRKLIKRRLSSLDQQILSRAIDVVKEKFSSQQPELKWFVTEYDTIKQAERVVQTGATPGGNQYWVDYPKASRFTGVVAWVSSPAPDYETAKNWAIANNGRVRGGSHTEAQADPLDAVKAASRDALKAAIDSLRHDKYISADPLSSDPTKWDINTVGSVAARLNSRTAGHPAQRKDT